MACHVSRWKPLLGLKNGTLTCRNFRTSKVHSRAVQISRTPQPRTHPGVPTTAVRLHHHHHPSAQRTCRPNGPRSVRWYSSGNQGGGAGKGGKGGGGEGFLQNFLKNFREGMKGSEVQESLKGFHEEREKMQQSYVVQQAKLKWKAMSEKVGAVSKKSSEKAQTGWSTVKDTSSKVYQEAADTELAKKGQAIGSQFAKDVQKTAEELAKTDVGLAVKKGSEAVKEDLLDDIIKESAPYKPPEKIMKRSELASDFSRPAPKMVTPNEEVRDVVTTKESKWKQQLREWRENNPVTNAFYSLKTRYDESDNIIIRASRVVTDKVEDLVSGTMTQSDMAETLAEIQKVDHTFEKEEFIQQCKYEIIPSVLEAFMQGNEHVLKDWCHEPAFNVLAAVMKQRHEPGVKLECKVLEVRDIDIIMAKMMEQGPVMVLAFQAQQLTRKKTAGDETAVTSETLEHVFYVWALCRDQSIYDPRTAWRVLEFGIQSSGKMLV